MPTTETFDQPTPQQGQKFRFETVFSQSGEVLRTREGPRTSFTLEEVDAAKSQAFTEGETAARAQADKAAAAALETIAQNLTTLSQTLNQEIGEIRREAVDLCTTAGMVAADRALQNYPTQTIHDLFQDILEHLRHTPRVEITIPEDTKADIAPKLEAMAANAGLETLLVLEEAPAGTPAAAPGNCTIKWDGGSMSRSRDDVLAALRQAATRWLHANTPNNTPDDTDQSGDDPVQLSLFDTLSQEVTQ